MNGLDTTYQWVMLVLLSVTLLLLVLGRMGR